MDRSKKKDIVKSAEKIIAEAINEGSEHVTTISLDPTAKYEAPDNLESESTILED